MVFILGSSVALGPPGPRPWEGGRVRGAGSRPGAGSPPGRQMGPGRGPRHSWEGPRHLVLLQFAPSLVQVMPPIRFGSLRWLRAGASVAVMPGSCTTVPPTP